MIPERLYIYKKSQDKKKQSTLLKPNRCVISFQTAKPIDFILAARILGTLALSTSQIVGTREPHVLQVWLTFLELTKLSSRKSLGLDYG